MIHKSILNLERNSKNMKRLRTAALDLTYDCNFRCLHCFNSSGEHMGIREELHDHEKISVAEQLAALLPGTLCLCGGETMLKKDLIYEICKKIKNSPYKRVNVSTVSNGFLITEEIVNKLEDSGLDLLQISLDGATPESHDWLRNKPGSFDRAINALTLLEKSKIAHAVAFTPTKRNISEIGDAIELAYSLGVSSFRVQPIMNLGRARDNLQTFFLNYKEYMHLRYILNIYQEKYIKDKKFRIEWGDPLDHMHYGIQEHSGLYQLSVDAYGDLLISPYLSIAFGNVRRGTIEEYWEKGVKDAWSNKAIKEIVSKMQSADSMDVSKWGLPEIFTTQNIMLDVLSSDYKAKTEEILTVLKNTKS